MRALCLAVAVAAASPAWAETIEIDLGAVVLIVSDSPTAQVFHIVDQLSEWDAFAHRQYGRWARVALTRDQEYRRLLQQHAELRRARGRGKGFEESFLVEDSIAAAADRAMKSGLLTTAEAAAEQAILEHFAPLVAGLIADHRVQLLAFRNQLLADRARLRPWIDRLSRLAELKGTIRVPVFLIANPDESAGGGGANGGRLVVEVPANDPLSFLLHETLHAVLAFRTATIREAAASAGISFQTLNEAIAYAFAPGLTGEAGRDLLAEGIAGYVIGGTPATDAYMQYYMMATVIRPLLRVSLDEGESLSVFLVKALERWRTVAPVAAGQQVAPRFEVASVKPLKPDSDAGGGGFFPGGRFAVSGATVQELVRLAYGVADYQILNAPGWATTEKYVIDARAGAGAPTRQEVLRMLQSLLADRFKLVVHSDSREMAAYVLEMARLDKSLGNQLRRSTIDCSTTEARERARAALPQGRRACATYMDGSSFLADGVEFTTLTTLLSSSLQAPIDDRTGLKGLFDWELRWSRDPGKDGPSLLVAVEEQLGLKLRSTRAPVSILVIDSVERPTPD